MTSLMQTKLPFCETYANKPMPINPDWPHYGRSETDRSYAIFVVAAYLDALGLGQWTNNFLLWLGRYEGLEQYIEKKEHDPVISVRNVLAKHIIEGRGNVASKAERRALLQDIARSILKQDFVYYKAFWGRDLVRRGGEKLWNPAKQSWLAFIEHHHPDDFFLNVWRSETPNTSEDLLQAMLLGNT